MTTNYHSAIATGESNAPATINNRLSDLDRAIVARAAEIAALNTSGVGSVYAQINNASGEADTSWVIDNISGTFLAGATVIYTVSGVVYASTVAANTSASPLTVTAAPGVTIPDNTVISQVPAGVAGKVTDTIRNIKDPVFGVKGDGTTETSAITAALPTGGNASVVFPSGTYQIDSGLTIDQNGTALQGVGVVTIRRSQTTDAGTDYVMLAIDGADGVIIDGLTFEQDEYDTGGDAGSDNHTGIRITGCNNVVIRNCSFLATGAYAIEVYNSTNVRIEGCYITKTTQGASNTRGAYGVGIIRSSNVAVTNCRIEKISCGICAIVRQPSDGTLYDDLRGIVIANNTISNTSEHGIYINYAMDVAITGNTLRNIDQAGIKVRAVECAIEGNSVHAYTQGIVVSEFFRNVTVGGNNVRIEYSASRSGATMIGVWVDVQGLSGLLAAAAVPSWITSSSRCENTTIKGNVLTYDGTADIEASYGVRLIGSTSHTTADDMGIRTVNVSGNTIVKFMTGILTQYVDQLHIASNILIGQGTPAVRSTISGGDLTSGTTFTLTSTAGFLAGRVIAYVRSDGTYETRTIDTVTNSTTLTVTSSIGGTIANGANVYMLPSDNGRLGHGINVYERTPYLQITGNLIRKFYNGFNYDSGAGSLADTVIESNTIADNTNYAITFNGVISGNSASVVRDNRYDGNGNTAIISFGVNSWLSPAAKGADATGSNVFGAGAGTLGANAGFILLSTRTGTTAWVPYWTSIT